MTYMVKKITAILIGTILTFTLFLHPVFICLTYAEMIDSEMQNQSETLDQFLKDNVNTSNEEADELSEDLYSEPFESGTEYVAEYDGNSENEIEAEDTSEVISLQDQADTIDEFPEEESALNQESTIEEIPAEESTTDQTNEDATLDNETSELSSPNNSSDEFSDEENNDESTQDFSEDDWQEYNDADNNTSETEKSSDDSFSIIDESVVDNHDDNYETDEPSQNADEESIQNTTEGTSQNEDRPLYFLSSSVSFPVEGPEMPILYLNSDRGYSVEATSSDTDVVSIYFVEGREVYIYVHNLGTARITATDSDGNEATCDVTVVLPEWNLSETDITESIIDVDELYDLTNIAIDYEGEWLDFDAISSNENVIRINGVSGNEVDYTVMGVGEAVITVSDQYGRTRTCQYAVTCPDLVVKNSALTYSIDEVECEPIWLPVEQGYSITYKSSDTSIIKNPTYYDDTGCELEILKPGKATITMTDRKGSKKTVTITVTQSAWTLEVSKKTAYISSDYIYIAIKNAGGYIYLNAKSSDTKVATATADQNYLEIEIKKVGTTKITVSDSYGKTRTCDITIKPDPISFGKDAVIKLDRISDYFEEEFRFENYYDQNNQIASVNSSNEKVAKVKRLKDSGGYYLTIVPLGKGTATITAKDQYGQSATIKITITQRYIDEMRYLEDLECSSIWDGLVYGQKMLQVYCPIAASVYTVISDKKYSASVDEDGIYTFKNLPRIAAGKKVAVVCQKGQAKYTIYAKVTPKYGGGLKASIKAQVYNGKILTPAITIKYGTIILKKGTDYTVKYTNNKNVGLGKATISFRGNYKGAKGITFKINPKGTALSKVITGKKAFTAAWKKQSVQTTGYQVQYSIDKTFKTGTKSMTISSNKTVKKTVKSLIGGKRYYIRVRTYKKTSGGTFYSAWSKAISALVKK